MKTFRMIVVFMLLVSLFFTDLKVIAATQRPSPCDEKMLPAVVKGLLNSEFPRWRPKHVSDIDEGDRKLWLEGPNADACPGVAVGRFRTTDTLSYAFLLVPKSGPTGGFKIVVFSKRTENDIYSLTLLDHADGRTYRGLVIFKVEPGKYKDWEGKKSIQIETDAFCLEWIEKGAQLYYWSDGRYHKL